MIRFIGSFLLVAIELVAFVGSEHGPTSVLALHGQPRNIELTTSNQPDFGTAVDVDYPGVRNMDGFSAIAPVLAILRNVSGHGIKAYVVRWEVIGARGSSQVHNLIPWADAGAREPLSGEEIVLKPGESRLVSPRFNWNVSPFEVQNKPDLLRALATGPLATEAAQARRIDISIDAVVYDDNVFSGPDKGDFYDRYECERNGEQDEGKAVLSLIDDNVTDDEVRMRLASDIEQGLESEGTDRESLLEASRGREAKRLLGTFNFKGRREVKELCLHLLTYDRTLLKRQ
jgi:hypothetical protein